MDKENVASHAYTHTHTHTHIYNEILLSHEKEWHFVICNNMNETVGYYV